MPDDPGETRACLRRATPVDTLGFLAGVVVPTLTKGAILRRPKAMRMAEMLGLDRRAVMRMQRLRAKYGPGPLLLVLPTRSQAVVLSPEHVWRILDGTPEPFSPAAAEKRAALAHFEPETSLISEPTERAERRRFNDQALESGSPVHSLADSFVAVVGEEAEELLSRAGTRLGWDDFITAWYRMVRRVVLGDGAREDHELTNMLAKLRAAANWVSLHPGRRRLAIRFHKRLAGHLARGEPGSLAGLIASMPKSGKTAPTHQVAQWLFAFDPGGMATFRALALLAAHPPTAERARQQVASAERTGRQELPFLRAAILESVRLWPTTPIILRETTRETQWHGGAMPANTSLLIFAPYFHRDDENLTCAHRFEPDLWPDGDAGARRPLVPFSAGPGICPGRQLVLILGSAVLAAILEGRDVALVPPDRLRPDRPLPGTLDNYSLRFTLTPS